MRKKNNKEETIIHDAKNLINALNKEIEILEVLKDTTNPTLKELLLKLKTLNSQRQKLYETIQYIMFI